MTEESQLRVCGAIQWVGELVRRKTKTSGSESNQDGHKWKASVLVQEGKK